MSSAYISLASLRNFMPPSYRVFLGAPAISDLQSTFNSTPSSYHWHTVSLTPTPSVNTPLELELPPASFNEASERLSAVYKGVIFGDESEDSLDASDDWVEADSRRSRLSSGPCITRGGLNPDSQT
jgi:hypothetical protein